MLTHLPFNEIEDSSDACYDVWFGDSCSDREIGGGAWLTRRDRIRHEYIRGTAQVEHFEDKAREAILK